LFVAAAAEVGTRRGAVHDAIAAQRRRWLDLLVRQAGDAQKLGELPADVDLAQLVFELEALLVAANTTCGTSTAVYRRGRAISDMYLTLWASIAG